jgi:hypothetical protein
MLIAAVTVIVSKLLETTLEGNSAGLVDLGSLSSLLSSCPLL